MFSSNDYRDNIKTENALANEPNELASRKKLRHCVAYLNVFSVGHSQCRFDEHR